MPVDRLGARTARCLVLLTLLLCGGGLWALHWYLGRPDRILAAQRMESLLSVRDQVLRYEMERGQLPARIEALVPRYLNLEQLEGPSHSPRYHFDPATRLLAETQPVRIRGLFTQTRPPLEVKLEDPQPLTWPVQAAQPPPHPPTPPSGPPAGGQGPGPASSAQATVSPTQLQAIPPPREDPDLLIGPAPTRQAPAEGPAAQGPYPAVAPKVCAGPALSPAPQGALVFEAEQFSELNYGWEVHPDPACGGGAYLHCKEGIANTEGQLDYKIGNFYATGDDREVSRLRYHLRIPATGSYRLLGRFWSSDFKCSNKICLAWDQSAEHGNEMTSTQPFRWQWCALAGGPQHLAAGDHYLSVFIHEDGVRLDQFLLTPQTPDEARPFQPNLEPGAGTAWQAGPSPPLHLSFDLKSMVLLPQLRPAAQLVLRRLRPANGTARLEVRLEAPGDPGLDRVLLALPLELAALEPLSFLELPLSTVDLAALPRREYLLRASCSLPGQQPLQACTTLLKPFRWEAFGPGGFLRNATPGPLDGDGLPRPDDRRVWNAVAEGSWSQFGILDFGLHFNQNSQHPQPTGTAYAQTRIRVAGQGTYLFKVQSDDQIRLWLDGNEIYHSDAMRPVTRSAGWLKVVLSSGEHRLRMRVNQNQGCWQAGLRIRTAEDQLAAVTGAE